MTRLEIDLNDLVLALTWTNYRRTSATTRVTSTSTRSNPTSATKHGAKTTTSSPSGGSKPSVRNPVNVMNLSTLRKP